MNRILKNKFVQGVLCAAAVVYCIYAINDFIGMARRQNVRIVTEQLTAAANQFNASPLGILRAETFLQQLKAIDTSATPADFKQAVNDYIISFEKGLNEMKSTQNMVTSYDGEIAEKKERLAEVINKYLTKSP